MTEQRNLRTIEVNDKDSGELFWVINDFEVPLQNDHVAIEQADGTIQTFVVLGRTWITAKQGENSFSRVRLAVKKVEPNRSKIYPLNL